MVSKYKISSMEYSNMLVNIELVEKHITGRSDIK